MAQLPQMLVLTIACLGGLSALLAVASRAESWAEVRAEARADGELEVVDAALPR